MKHTKKMISLALCIFMLSTVFTACRKDNEAETTKKSTTKETVTIEDPVIKTPDKKETTTSKKTVTTTKETVAATKRVETTTEKQSVTTRATTYPSTTRKPEQTTQKRETTIPEQEAEITKKTEPVTKRTVTTRHETTNPKPYSCGSKNHHCTTKEEHTFIVSLENKGCPTCGSHSCRSFYALDEWGQPCYDIAKCPKYSEKKDPNIYCEYCGKKSGLGGNGTCVRFTVDTKCPECGKSVKAKTCHSH